MFWARLIGAAVVLVVAAVTYDSFSGDEDKDKSTEDKDKGSFTPAENEMRHVELNRPFDISVGQEVLLCDGETRGYLTFEDTNQSVQFTFNLDGVGYDLEFGGTGEKVREVGGYMIVLLDLTPDSRTETEEVYGKNHYLAKVIISAA